jgi:Protein of unknown function (DUF2798)
MNPEGGAHDPNGSGAGQGRRPGIDPKYASVLLPAVMATAMSLVMSLVDTVVRVGLEPNLMSAWLGSFTIGVVVAAPTAILIAPAAKRLVAQLTGGQHAQRRGVRLPERARPLRQGGQMEP